MTTLRKTILIEANREDSIEVKDYGTNSALASSNKAEWTNILKGVNLKKGDLLQFDSACINSKGSNPQAIEFDGQNVSEFRKYTDNFAIFQFSHYINHNLEYSCGLPLTDREGEFFVNLIQQNAFFNTYFTNPTYGQVDPALIPTNTNGHPYLFNGLFSNTDQDGLVSPTMITTTNFFTRISNGKYALINRFYKGHTRPTMDAVSDYDASISTSEFKLKMESGFQNPSNLAARLTAILHQTNQKDDFLNNEVVVGGIPNTDFKKNIQAAVNGKALINVACNGLFVNDNQNVFYQSIATDDPMRFENGVNILLQADLVNLQNDINCNQSSANQSILNVATMAGATINVGTNQIIFTFDPASHADVVSSYKVGYEIVFISGTNIFDTTQKTIIQTVAPAAPGSIGLEFSPPTTVQMNPTDVVCEIAARGPGEFMTNTPIFLFANKNPPGTEKQYDNYSPHLDPESFDLNGFSFLNGIDPTKQPRSFGKWTLTRNAYQTLTSNGSIEFNHTILIELNDGGGTTFGFRALYPEVFLKWTGSNTAADENYIACRDTENNIYTVPFAYDDGTIPKGFNILDEHYYNYNPNAPTPDNEWTNESNGHNRTFTAQTLGTNYAYDYQISSSDDPAINYSINAQFGKSEIVRLYLTATNEYLGFGTYVNHGTDEAKIIWNGDITISPTEFFNNNKFQNYIAPNMPFWTFDPANTSFNAGNLGSGIITRDSVGLTFIRQTNISNLQVGTTYEFVMRREDAIANDMYIRTQNGVNNVNVLWDNGSTTNLRVISTNGAGNLTTAVSFQVLTAVDGIEIYFQANGQSISEVSLLQQGTGGGAVSETVWNLGVVEDVREETQTYVFDLQGATDPPALDGEFADFRLGQILPTNMLYNEKNIKLIKKFCNNTEKYVGNEIIIDKIATDDDGYEIRVDLGRTDDSKYSGFSLDPVKDGKVLTSNLVNTSPLIFSWLKGGDPVNDTIVNPRKFTPFGDREQRVKCRSRYKGDATNRLNYKGSTGSQDVDLNISKLTSDNLFFFNNPTNSLETFDDTLSRLNNVGVYPIYYKEIINANNPNGIEGIDFNIHKIIAFELVEELTAPQTDIFKVQWGIPALFSPQFCDCNQVMVVNPEITLLPPFTAEPEIPALDPATSSPHDFDIFKTTSFVNIGSQNPTCVYNETLQRFTFTELHLPVQLNSRDSSTGEGSIVCQFGNIPIGLNIPGGMFVSELDPDASFSQIVATNLIEGEFYVIIEIGANTPWGDMGVSGTPAVGSLFQFTKPENQPIPKPAIPANATGIAGQLQNPGRNDSQAGIFLKDIFFQVEAGEQDIENSNSPGSVLMTRDTFYNSIMYKMGFEYYTLKPIRFSDNPFVNRYNPYYQNRYNDNGRIFTLSPITTNSDFDIANATSLNIFPQYRKQKGEPKFKLGYNNNEAVNLIVNSYSITADNLPSQLNHGFYRIYVDFPSSAMDYIGATQKLGNCIAYSLRNYNTGSYFFSYASSYEIPITQDMPLNAIRVSIRTSDGRVAKNLNPKCVCFFKITREVPLLPTLQEQEQEIMELKEKNKKAYDEIMEQFNKQQVAKDKAFKEAQVQALAEGTQLIEVPIGDGYLGQQNTIAIQEPDAINLLGIPQMIEPYQIIELQQNAQPGIVEAIGNLPPPPLQFDFQPIPLQQNAIDQILQVPMDSVVQGLIPTENIQPPIQETQYDFTELAAQEVPMIDLAPEVAPIEFGNVEITPDQPDLFTSSARYTKQVEDLLTDEKNKFKIDITRQIIKNILDRYTSADPNIGSLQSTLVESAKNIANSLELIYDRIDKAETQQDYKNLKQLVSRKTKFFSYTPGGDQIETISNPIGNSTKYPKSFLNELTYLFYEQGGGFGTELAQAFGNQFTIRELDNVFKKNAGKITFNRNVINDRMEALQEMRSKTAGMTIKERKRFIREETTRIRKEKQAEQERGRLRRAQRRQGKGLGKESPSAIMKKFRLNTTKISDRETREQLNRRDMTTSPKTRTTASEFSAISKGMESMKVFAEKERQQKGDK